MDLTKFIYTETLEANPTQKTLYLLGKIYGHQNQGQAIIIITPKLPQLTTKSATHNNKQQLQKDQQHQHTPILPFTSITPIFQNDIYSKHQVTFQSQFQIQSIFPITQKHKQKYQQKLKYIEKQTRQMYLQKKDVLLKKELAHVDWVKNIIQGKAEQQRVLYEDSDIMLLPDFKFHNLKQVQNLHLLCIFKDYNLHSIRDLNSSHLQMLQNLQKTLKHQLQKHFTFQSEHQQSIGIQNCRVYFHYPPTFYQLHLHIQSLELDTKTSNAQRCHMLSSVIQNIKLKCDYYQVMTLNCFKEEEIVGDVKKQANVSK